jgi:phasin family protein
MKNAPEAFWLQGWKGQLEAGLRLVETLVEGSTRLHEIQLEAAAEAHADLEATRKAIAAATDAAQLFRLQAEWTQANAQKSAAYWRAVHQAAMETGAALLKSARGAPGVPLPEPALLGAVDGAYRQWLELAQRLYHPIERETA